jgi:hypothetical protein
VEAEGLLGTKLVLEGGVLEVFSHGVSSMRLRADEAPRIHRMPRKDGLALSIRGRDRSALIAFSGEQAPKAEELIAAFESSAPGN